MTAISLQGIAKQFGRGPSAVWAVQDVNLQIASGEFFFLLGPSGCGKTTLLRMIAGLIEPSAGTVHFASRDVTNLPVEKRNTAMVFQNYALWPHMTVGQNVEFGPKMRRVPGKTRRDLSQRSLQRVEMQSFSSRKPNQLSGGQQQRVALARVLAAEPDCMLLDEPLSNLDAKLRLQMRSELRELVKSTSTTAIYVTHDQKEALCMADRIAVMNDGRIVQVGTPAELYHQPSRRFVAEFLGEANFIQGRVITAESVLEIETPCGKLLAQSSGRTYAPGTEVTCCVRPESIAIAGPGQQSAAQNISVFSATVEQKIFLGETCQYDCRLPEQHSWKVTTLSDRTLDLAIGGEVELQVAPADVAVLPA